MKKVVLSIPEISCGHCTSSIDAALNELDGVISATSSVDKKETEVEFEEKIISIGAIIEVIDDIGFAATVVGE
ncbi:copper chaperone [Ignatzschineria ureiclastica]|uniref:Copper chaperone n=1 Tax=Ignatzschineria ureiclastica TaxID=472582 RepID=A0A2U2AE34_9GAMM|nr:heavy-metal-associated domain-containing protein [Ignatzschineria ureiclastica]PWD80910.1 copper chaperone [Ignatzschineria ureiclastica]GGZ93946.1 copper chaperone CopZ [Ignatzschineria ureiclastica]